MFQIGEDRVALVTDSSCDLSDELLSRYDIRMVCLRINAAAGEYRDRIDINGENIYELLQNEVPRTSLPSPEEISSIYQDLIDSGCTRILHLSISSGLSGTCNMARLVADEFSDRIRVDVVDTLTLSCGLGQLVTDAAEHLEAGMSVDDVIARVNALRKTQLGTFVIRTLEFLRKGGRIGLVEGVIGSLLQLKPVIFVNDQGIYQTLAKARGMKNAVSTMCDECVRRYAGKKVRLSVVHGSAQEEAQKLAEELSRRLDCQSVTIAPVSPVLAVHTGPGLLGIILQHAD